MWDLDPTPRTEPRTPALGAWHLTHWTTNWGTGHAKLSFSTSNSLRAGARLFFNISCHSLNSSSTYIVEVNQKLFVEWTHNVCCYGGFGFQYNSSWEKCTPALWSSQDMILCKIKKRKQYVTALETLFLFCDYIGSDTSVCISMWVKSLNHVRLFATPWTIAYQAPLSMGFSRQEYWSGSPFPSPGDLPNPGTEPGIPAS